MRVPRIAKAAAALSIAAAITLAVPSPAQAAVVGKLSRTIYLAGASAGYFDIPYSGDVSWDVPADGWYLWSFSPLPDGFSPRSIYLAKDRYQVKCWFDGTSVDWQDGYDYIGWCQMNRGSDNSEVRLPYSGFMHFDIPEGTYTFSTQLAE
ncbi:hypothetical protein [Peterkaempfera sp. SMS 1(5)a]|uniref:hypothetical protein n=1 Tax=Peterkaempfera podocarpi TaxID=3232308 RepID=UPI003672D8EE